MWLKLKVEVTDDYNTDEDFWSRYLLATSPQLLESSSSSTMTSPQEETTHGTPVNTGSWRKAIFERVCTPQDTSSQNTTGEIYVSLISECVAHSHHFC